MPPGFSVLLLLFIVRGLTFMNLQEKRAPLVQCAERLYMPVALFSTVLQLFLYPLVDLCHCLSLAVQDPAWVSQDANMCVCTYNSPSLHLLRMAKGSLAQILRHVWTL